MLYTPSWWAHTEYVSSVPHNDEQKKRDGHNYLLYIAMDWKNRFFFLLLLSSTDQRISAILVLWIWELNEKKNGHQRLSLCPSHHYFLIENVLFRGIVKIGTDSWASIIIRCAIFIIMNLDEKKTIQNFG